MINYELRDYNEDVLTVFDFAHIKEILDEPIKYDWFGAHLIRLCRKADAKNLAKLAEVYPDVVAAYSYYRYGKILPKVRALLSNPEYYEYWIPKLMEKANAGFRP